MFHENFKTLRKEKGFSQEQLAVRLNVVRQTVSKWEKGLSVPDAEMLVDIAEVFNVSVSDLLGKSIDEEQRQDWLAKIALELEKLNELLVLRHTEREKTKQKVFAAVGVALVILFMAAIYDSWNEMFYEFGQSLYHLFH